MRARGSQPRLQPPWRGGGACRPKARGNRGGIGVGKWRGGVRGGPVLCKQAASQCPAVTQPDRRRLSSPIPPFAAIARVSELRPRSGHQQTEGRRSGEKFSTSIRGKTRVLLQQFQRSENFHVQSLFPQQPAKRQPQYREAKPGSIAAGPTPGPPGQGGRGGAQRLGRGAAPGHGWERPQPLCFRTYR